MSRCTSRSATGSSRGTCRTATSAIEYPPGALPAFVLPSLVASGENPVYEPELNDAARGYARSFAALMTLLLAATVVLTALSRWARSRATVGHAAVALGLVGATPLLLGELALTRFDALPVALTALAVAALLRGRSRLAAVALGARRSPRSSTRSSCCRSLAIYVARRRGRRGRPSSGSRSPRRRSPSSCCRSSHSRPAMPGSRSAPSSTRGRPGREPPGERRDRASAAPPTTSGSARSASASTRAAPAPCGARTSRAASGRSSACWAASPRSRSWSASGSPPGVVPKRRPPASCGISARSSRHSSRSGGCCPRSSSCWLVPLVPLVAGRRGRRRKRATRDRPRRDAGLVPRSLPRLRERAWRLRDGLLAAPERAAARRAGGTRLADSRSRPVAEECHGGKQHEGGHDGYGVGRFGPDCTHGREEHQERARDRRDGRPPPPRPAQADADHPGEKPEEGGGRASTSGPSAGRARGSTSDRGRRRTAPPPSGRSPPSGRASQDRRTRRGARSRTSRPRGSNGRAWRSAHSGSPRGSARPPSARAAPCRSRRPSAGGAGVAGALVAAASVAAAFRPAKSGFQSSFTKSWNTAQENVPGWASTASLAVRAEDRVVGVPAVDAVGEADQVLLLARAAA